MKKLILLLLFLFPVLGLAQTNQQRIAIAIQNNSGYAKIIPFAQITVCTYNDLLQCNSPVTIYSDSALTQSIPYPFFADANGNFSYYSNAGTYIEKVCAPLNQCYNYPITLISSSSSSGCGSAGCVLLNSATDQIINQTAGSSFGAVLDSGNVEFTAGGTGDFLATMAGGEAAFTVGNGFNVTDISTTGIDLTTQGPVDISGNLYSAAFTTTVDESSGSDWTQSVGGNYTLNATEAFFNMAANWTGLSSGTAANCLALDSSNNVVLTACSNLTGAVQTAPTASQTISQPAGTLLQVLYDSNSSSGFKITNTSTGTSGGTLLALSNGTDEGFFGLSGTGTSFPGYFLFQLNTSGGQLKFDTNNGDIVFAPNGGNINFSNLLSAPCLSTDGSGNLLPTCSGGGTYPTTNYYGLSGGSSWITSHLSDDGTNVTSTEPIIAPSATFNGSANGNIILTTTGTPPGTETTNQLLLTVPNTVTHYTLEFPGAQPSGSDTYLSCTSANPSVCSWAAGGSSSGFPITLGSTSIAASSTTTSIAGLTLTSPTLTTPALGTPASGVLTNTTGLPAASIVAGALANGMTATTQTTGDNTTHIATDAFVLANAGSTGNIVQAPTTTAANTIVPGNLTTVGLSVNCSSSITVDCVDMGPPGNQFRIDQYGRVDIDSGDVISGAGLSVTSGGSLILNANPNGTISDLNVLSGWAGTATAGTVVAGGTTTHSVVACATSCTNAFAVVDSNPNSNAYIQTIGSHTVKLDGTYTVTGGEYVCTSATTGGEGTPQSTPCTTQQIGFVTTPATSVTSAMVFLDFQPASSGGGGSGTVTSVGFTGGLISVASPTTTPAFTVAGTSGGVPYFSSASTWASSALLTHYGVVYGGGAGAAPVATAADTTTTHALFATATAPAFRAIAIGDLPAFPLSCQPGIGDGLNAIPAGTYLTTTCRNETGQTWTITAIRCVADSGSSTCNATNGAGTDLLTGAVTGTSTYANGTQSGTTTIASGDYLKITFVADGTSKQIGIDVAGTY